MKTRRDYFIVFILVAFVLSNAAMANTPEPTSALAYQQTTNTRIKVEENHLRFFTGGTERITVDENGNVGIGTISPVAKLSIKSSGTIGAGNFENSSIYVTDGTQVLGIDPNQIFAEQMLVLDAKTFLSFNTGREERIRIDENGKVGIGTMGPQTKFHVEDSTGYNFGFLLKNSHPAGHGLLVQGGGSTGNRFIMQLKDASGANRVTVKDTGEFGIGTTDPDNLLHINSSSQNTDFKISNTYGTTGRNRIIMNVSDRTWAIENDGNLNILKIRDSSGAQDRFCIDYSGRVGIGTTSPSYRLHVSGQVKATQFHGDKYFAQGVQVWPDYVFEDTYHLNEIEEVEKFIEKNHHLPDIPSAAEVKENGIELVDMQAKLLQKIEELTLYVIEQNKKIENQSKQLSDQQKEIEKLKRK